MAVTVQQEKKKGRKGIPRELIYEMRYGKPIYYRDYDRVLSGEKTLEEVVGSSLQSWIIDTLIWFLHRYLDYKKYKILANNAKKVIWIITRRGKILVAEKGKNWIITDWNNEIKSSLRRRELI
jgi:hypothetical protein